MVRYFPASSSRGRRQASLRNQLADLILNEFLITTEAQAKILKSEIERLISRVKSAQEGGSSDGGKVSLAARRRVLALLPKESAVKKLLERVVPQFSNRVGGYVRVVKLPHRRGDNAPMARLEFVEGIAEPAEKEKREKTQKRKSEKNHRKEAADKSLKKATKTGGKR